MFIYIHVCVSIFVRRAKMTDEDTTEEAELSYGDDDGSDDDTTNPHDMY